MSLKSQRRLAAEILKVGEGRVWINPDRIDDVEVVISREEIKRLIREGAIRASPTTGVSRARARVLRGKKKKGRKRGPGMKSGALYSRVSKKQVWIKKIRALRKNLREYKTNRTITQQSYRRLYTLAGGGVFRSTVDLEHYIKAHDMWRER